MMRSEEVCTLINSRSFLTTVDLGLGQPGDRIC